MKKIIFFILASTIAANFLYAQPKDTIYMANPRMVGGMFCLDVKVGIPTGKTWRVGSSNIRVDFYTTNPTGKLTVHPDNPVQNALPCLNSGNYSAMTTTSINQGTAISLNITRLATCCYLTAGTYILGTLRFDTTATGVLSASSTICDTVRSTSVIQDSVKALVYGCSLDTCWQKRNFGIPPQQCHPIITGGEFKILNVPTSFELYDNYPNPFNPATTIKYDVPKASDVKIYIYDMLGKQVQMLVNERKEAGSYEVKWEATNFASGTYFYKMETNAYTKVKKMVLMK